MVFRSGRDEEIVDRSGMRYTAAGCLIAAGLLIGGSGGVAMAQPGGPHVGDGGNQNGQGPHKSGGGQTSNGSNGFNGPKRGPGDGPRTRVGSGRHDAPRSQPSQRGFGQTNSSNDSGTGPISSRSESDVDPSGAVKPGGEVIGGEDPKTDPKTEPTGDVPAGCRKGCIPGFPFPFPFPIPSLLPTNGGDWTGTSVQDYLNEWTNYANGWASTFQEVIVPPPPKPEPEPAGPAFRGPQIAEEEPVVDAGPTGGGGGPAEPAAAGEPPVLEVPLVVAPPVPLAPPVPVPPPASTPGWLGPRAPVEPVPGRTPPSIGQSVPPVREPLPADAGAPMGTQASYRVGYSDYLRNAGIAQLAGAALPGVGGILILTAGGGFIGYRQAKAGHSVRSRTAARFLH